MRIKQCTDKHCTPHLFHVRYVGIHSSHLTVVPVLLAFQSHAFQTPYPAEMDRRQRSHTCTTNRTETRDLEPFGWKAAPYTLCTATQQFALPGPRMGSPPPQGTVPKMRCIPLAHVDLGTQEGTVRIESTCTLVSRVFDLAAGWVSCGLLAQSNRLSTQCGDATLKFSNLGEFPLHLSFRHDSGIVRCLACSSALGPAWLAD